MIVYVWMDEMMAWIGLCMCLSYVYGDLIMF